MDGEIGKKIRRIRMARKLTLRELAEIVECSESLLSRIENAKVVPSLTMLHKLSSSLEINVTAFFDQPGSENIVQRAGERPVMDTSINEKGDHIRLERLIPENVHSSLQAHIHILDPGSASDGLISHEGDEMGYVLKGEVEINVNGHVHVVREGDVFAFRSDLKHGYRNIGRGEARILWVNTPPTF